VCPDSSHTTSVSGRRVGQGTLDGDEVWWKSPDVEFSRAQIHPHHVHERVVGKAVEAVPGFHGVFSFAA